MDERQRAFLANVAAVIPRLFEAVGSGNVKAEVPLGERRIGPRRVRLKLVAEVIDPGANPLATHSGGPADP